MVGSAFRAALFVVGSALIGLGALSPANVGACPRINGLVDYNCDGRVLVAVVGDSIVRGVGDIANNNNGGYVKRLEKKFPRTHFANLGYRGYTSGRLYAEVAQILSKAEKKKYTLPREALQAADAIIVDIGRNDFFSGLPSANTVTMIERLVDLLQSKLTNDEGVGPLIRVATLLPTKRAYQRGFIHEVNMLLLAESALGVVPVALRYDLLPESIISIDGIHPSTKGYRRIAAIAAAYVQGTLTNEMVSRRSDRDGDGVYDVFERIKFGSDPTLLDSDGDILPDGEEIFSYGSNPTAADSDSDGLSDGIEITSSHTSLLLADTDSDALSDGFEVLVYRSDPLNPDSDGDTLTDGAEVSLHLTDPSLADTDADGVDDGTEIANGSDPLTP